MNSSRPVSSIFPSSRSTGVIILIFSLPAAGPVETMAEPRGER